ncbi:MAG: MBL fold metallo-hydrolase [Dehalococcoidia bacterium]|nr:MBL fold metallo-hydrolase [Dehalococcoidia bacterium]
MLDKPYKIYEDIYMVGSSDISHSMDCCVYLVDAGELVLIDSGAGQSTHRLTDNIQALGLLPERLSTILVTHAHIDHVGSLYDLKQMYGLKVIAHKEDVGAIQSGKNVGAEYYGVKYRPCNVDIVLHNEESELNIGSHEFKFVHIPGHTPGSIAIVLELEGKRLLFGQDIHGPYHPNWGGEPQKAVKSLKRLQDIQADILCEGHYGIIKPAERVFEFIEGFLDDLR